MAIEIDRFKKSSRNDQATAWANWLSDDPDALDKQSEVYFPPLPGSEGGAQPRASSRPSRAPVAPAPPAPEVSKKGDTTNLSINISLPKIDVKRQQQRLRGLPLRKIAIWAAVALVLLLASLALRLGLNAIHRHHQAQQAASIMQRSGQNLAIAPDFQPLLPSGKSPSAIGFDAKRGSYNFSDNLHGTQLMVSEQKLPASFSGSPGEAIVKLAQSVKATSPLDTSSGQAYLSTDAKSGAQTVVMATDKLLLFAQSAFVHTPTDWSNYLNSLQ